jgi:hypothetical protein
MINDVSKYITKLKSDHRAQHFKNLIAQDPTQVTFMGAEYIVRFSQPSNSKVIHYAGFKNKELVSECYIIINNDAQKPDKLYPIIVSDTGEKYQIIDYTKDYGDNCYILNLETKR